MNPKKKMAKSLKSLSRKKLMESLPDSLDGKMKVTVMADDEKGLKEGLEKAGEITESMDKSGVKGMLEEAFKNRKSKKKSK